MDIANQFEDDKVVHRGETFVDTSESFKGITDKLGGEDACNSSIMDQSTFDQKIESNNQFVTNLMINTEKKPTMLELEKFNGDSIELDSSSNGSEQVNQFTISWINLDYVVESKWYKLSSQRKPILNGLCGSFKSGQLSAVLGPSGAGKSTLIDCLMGKRDRGLSGKTRVTFSRGDNKKRKPLRIATIPQDDHLLETLTVAETFMFASKIKNAHLEYEEDDLNQANQGRLNLKRKPFDHNANVQRVIQQLNLSSCATLKCGKLSGGQYKRVSIGQELLSRPDLMILDEPTSGLDSVTCYQTVAALRALIDSSPYPMAIVAIVHQPDIEVFNLFHKAYVLASNGCAIYEGPTDLIFDTISQGLELSEARRKVSEWQLSTGSSPSNNLDELRNQALERAGNPAKLIVQVAANNFGFEIISCLNEIQIKESRDSPFGSKFDIRSTSTSSSKNFALNPQLDSSCAYLTAPQFDYNNYDPRERKADIDKTLSISSVMSQKRGFKVYFRHLAYHTQRSWLTIVRDPMLFAVQVFLHILVPSLISYSYQGTGTDACPKVGPFDVIEEVYRDGNILEDLNIELRSAFENLGYMFFQLYVIIFAAVCVTCLTYPLAMHVLLKEYRNGWYSMSSYFLGRTLADLPVPTLNVFLAMGISYHLTGQALSPYAWRFLSVASLVLLGTLVAQTQGLMFGALLMNAPQAAVFVAPASTAPLVVVSGFLFRIQTLPYVLQILSKLSFFTYLINGFIVSRYGFNRCPCEESDFVADTSHQIPPQARGVIELWTESFSNDYPDYQNRTVSLTEKLVDTIAKAKTFGYEMTDCSQVKPFPMLDYQLGDDDLIVCYVALILMLIFFRWLAYAVLSWKINSAI